MKWLDQEARITTVKLVTKLWSWTENNNIVLRYFPHLPHNISFSLRKGTHMFLRTFNIKCLYKILSERIDLRSIFLL